MPTRGGGRGPRPKDPDKKTNPNGGAIPHTKLDLQPIPQPPLGRAPGWLDDAEWPARTKAWWKHWGESPLSRDFTQTDWDFLAETAVIHAKVWLGDLRWAAELRLRVAKFGATTEDRARLRIFAIEGIEPERNATADALDVPRYEELRVVPDAG